MMLEDLYRLLKTSHVQAQGIVDTLTVPLLVLDERFRIVTANNAFLRAFKVERDDIIEKTLFSLGSGQWDIPDLKVVFEMIIPKSAGVLGYQVTHDFPLIGKRSFVLDARRLVHPDDNSVNITISAAGLDRFRITTGPAAELRASRVLPVGMMIHELTTNAIKYGALSVPDGAVLIGWNKKERDGKQLLVVEWREKKAPPATTRNDRAMERS